MKLNTLVVALGLATSLSAHANTSITAHQTPYPEMRSAINNNHQQALPLAASGPIGNVGPQAEADCSSFVGLNGWPLIDKLAASDPQCVSPLYNLKGADATALFSESNIRIAAAAVRDRALNYTGTDTTGIEAIIYYIRAALYVQFYSPEDVAPYSSAATADFKTALTNLFNNGNIWTVSTENSGVLKEALIWIDSAHLGADFNYVTKRVLSEYNADWEVNWGMNAAANSIFTTLFRAQWMTQ